MKKPRKMFYLPEFLITLIHFDKHQGLNFFELHKKIDVVYSYVHDMKHFFVERGWITIKHVGKQHMTVVTEKGRRVLSATYELLEELNIDVNNIENYKRHKVNKKTKAMEENHDGAGHESVSEEVFDKKEEVVDGVSGTDLRENGDKQEN